MSIVVIGAGPWGKNHIRTLQKMGALSSVVETEIKLHPILKQEFPGVPVFENLTEALNSQVRGVVIATPAPTHFEIANQVLDLGFNLLIEKPLTLSVVEGAKLLEKARQKDRHLMVGHLIVHHPCVQKLKQLMREGSIGKPLFFEFNRLGLAKVRVGENALSSLGVHDLAVLDFLLDGKVPTKTRAWGRRGEVSHSFDHVEFELEFDGGLWARIRSSWLWPEKVRKFLVLGSEGSFIFNEEKGELNLIKHHLTEGFSHFSESPVIAMQDSQPLLELELKNFLDLIFENKLCLTDGHQGLRVVQMLEEAEKCLL